MHSPTDGMVPGESVGEATMIEAGDKVAFAALVYTTITGSTLAARHGERKYETAGRDNELKFALSAAPAASLWSTEAVQTTLRHVSGTSLLTACTPDAPGSMSKVVCIIVPLEFFTSRLKRVSFFDSFLSRRHCAPLSITIPLVRAFSVHAGSFLTLSQDVDTAQDIATLSSSSLAECGTRLLVPHSSIVIFFIKFSSYLRVTPVTPNPCSLLAPTPTAPAVDCTDTFRYCPSLS
ncbi:hypothetical protein FB45DRAFT_1049975 [Roridomyces roridus]|uniref:Uncharacterized protein n=1 Tax=Roridomyces roridus TaxID=1738132 RepID=A0AAD7CKF8_9AGAR|nr:hypothetical protein FB45DRAFT_1049975 [Roridomyces roridus]